MKRFLLLFSVVSASSFAMDGFVAIIQNDNNDDGNGYIKKTNVVTVSCSAGDGVTRGELESMIEKNENVSEVCTSNISDFSYLMLGRISEMSSFTSGEGGEGGVYPDRKFFNQDISKWDVSNGTNFEGMFYGLEDFNKEIGDWDVSNGEDFNAMFKNASSFNQEIGDWDVSNALSFDEMFRDALVFNHDIGDWDVSNNTDFGQMFNSAKAFNQNLNDWNVSNGLFFDNMFKGAEIFNKPLNKWDVSKASSFYYMFKEAKAFNQDIHLWNVKNASLFGGFSDLSPLEVDNIPCDFGGNCSLDLDGDGFPDNSEVILGFDPNDPNDFPKLINHPLSGSLTLMIDEEFKYYDNGGDEGDYSNSLYSSLTLEPEQDGELINITFDSFLTAHKFDKMYIYDGSSSSTGKFLKSCYSRNCEGLSFTASTAGGQLTFLFNSNSSYSSAGWEATVRPIIPPNTDTDGDGIIDAIDPDDDNDSFSDDLENISGTDPLDFNDQPLDYDGDGLVSGEDLDDDNDGHSDVEEISMGTNPLDENDYPLLILHPTSSSVTTKVVDGIYKYYDDGGPNSDHDGDMDTVLVFTPQNVGDVVSVTFKEFRLSSYRAELYVYSGNSTDYGDLLVECESVDCVDETYTSLSPNGELTFRFRSGGSWLNDGWFAKISSSSP